jgi:hypothetical protein
MANWPSPPAPSTITRPGRAEAVEFAEGVAHGAVGGEAAAGQRRRRNRVEIAEGVKERDVRTCIRSA